MATAPATTRSCTLLLALLLLGVAPCPVDCIAMVPLKEDLTNWKWKYPVFKIKQAA